MTCDINVDCIVLSKIKINVNHLMQDTHMDKNGSYLFCQFFFFKLQVVEKAKI